MTASVLRIIPSASNHSRGQLWWQGRAFPCALGIGGVLPACDKREGDDASPAGAFSLLRLYYRPDRLDKPETKLPARPMAPNMGWCDDAGCGAYNSTVELPHSGSAEALWRDDGVYDLLVAISHNQGPAIPHMGSAIFLHVARDDFRSTRGCIAIARDALLEILPEVSAETVIRIHMP